MSLRDLAIPETFLREIPKAELHIHIEGSLEPELMFEIAQRNGVVLRYASIEEVRRAYDFSDLQSFLDVYYEATQVLLHEQDFYDLTRAYLQKVASQNVRHAEIFFDPQAHTGRGVPFETVITGIRRALVDGEQQLDVSSKLIMCFLRHLSAQEAMETLHRALPYEEWIVGVGLDSSEVGHPPEDFKAVFDRAREHGFLTVAHAGEEGPPEYIWQALEELKVSRIDHGVRCVEDPQLVEKLVAEQIPLTVCPLSNVKLRVFDSIQDHNLKRLLDLGLRATVNSDDPAYFGGYIAENFHAAQEGLHLSQDDVYRLVKNSFQASFLSAGEKQQLLDELDDYFASYF
jgi:adenosine deaminase